MSRLTTDEITKLLATMSAAWPSFRVSKESVLVWGKCLGDIPYQVLHKATLRLICTNKFPPSISELRDASLDVVRPHEVTSLDAWGEVITAIAEYGYYQEREALASMSAGAAYVVRRMGWSELCQSEVDKASVIRAQFCKLYDHCMNEKRRQAVLPESLRSVAGPTAKALEQRDEEAESPSGGFDECTP